MEARACVFVDGENLRHSLLDLFRREGAFKASHYLPREANWSAFFDWIVLAATSGTHHRLRTYWFVTREIDCSPYRLNTLGRADNTSQLHAILMRHAPFQRQLAGLQGEARRVQMDLQLQRLRENQRSIEQRFKNWTSAQNSICIKHRAVEFRRAGAIPYDLFERRFGREKCVDIQLACDMIILRETYDAAIIVSGDQDYVPAAQILKDSGKTVINVAFEKGNGDLLPGGARQLNIVADSSLRVPYEKLRSFMGLELPRQQTAAVSET